MTWWKIGRTGKGCKCWPPSARMRPSTARTVMASTKAIPWFELPAGDRVRLLFEYDGHYCPLFWFSVGKDASFYFGIRKRALTEAKKACVELDQSSLQTTIRYDQGSPIEPANGVLDTKISVHASGIVHTGMRPGIRFVREKMLRDLRDPTMICLAVFQHPREFECVKSIRKRDVLLKYPIDECSPFWVQVHASPDHVLPVLDTASASYTSTLFFQCCGMHCGIGLSITITICHGPILPWPPYSYVVFPPEPS